jgi:hypothetical protein
MNVKANNIIFWVTTTLIFLFEGVMPLFFFQSEAAKEGIRHLGYPDYFSTLLVFFKVPGTLSLIIPKVPARIKEWAYAGFAFDFIAACISHAAVDGFGGEAISPLVALLILVGSYVTYHKLFVKNQAH